mgnify:CR=1 FL=1
MELERYLRDAKAGWVMGPTNEVLRQFVGKAVLLGFESLDYWNQTYNRRAVENELKKLDAAGKRELAEQLLAAGGRAGRRRSRRPARLVARPSLLVPGLCRGIRRGRRIALRPGATTVVALEPGDRLTVRDIHGGQRAAARASRTELGRSGRALRAGVAVRGAEEHVRRGARRRSSP